MKMHRIAIMDHVGAKAGMDYYSSSLAKGFIEQQCKVDIYSNFIGIEPESINYHPLYEGHASDNTLIKLVKFITSTLKASFSARKKKTDLVVLHLFSAVPIMVPLIMIPKLFWLKTAVISHDVSSFTDNDNSLVQNLVYNKLSDFIVVHNQFSYDTLLKNVQIDNPKKVVIIKHGGYLDHIGENPSKQKVREDLGLEQDGKYILFFGQIKDAKGLDILLEAMRHTHEDIKLIIAGKPWRNDFASYDKQIHDLGLHDRVVKMIRFIEDEEREKLFFATDVNVLPYRVIFQSGVLLMAMSHSLPVIASDLPANKEIIEDKVNGLLFKSEDSEDLAKKITLFFDDAEIQIILAKNSLQTIKNEYNWNDIAQSYLELLHEK